MTFITLRVLDGADRGRIYSGLPTPVTIGREEGNTIQLNDERVSRFHLKIQEDHDKLVLTDLESTNGTKVNGEDIQLRILRHGDVIFVGRSVLLFGSREQIAERLAALRVAEGPDTRLDRLGQGTGSAAAGQPGVRAELVATIRDADTTFHCDRTARAAATVESRARRPRCRSCSNIFICAFGICWLRCVRNLNKAGFRSKNANGKPCSICKAVWPNTAEPSANPPKKNSRYFPRKER